MIHFLSFSFIFVVSFAVAFVVVRYLIAGFARAGIVGKDVHKPGNPEVPEMGGLALVAGFVSGILLTVAFVTFWHPLPQVDLISLFAALAVVLIVTPIGIVDDLIGIHQLTKTLLPLAAALPLSVVRAGVPVMILPFFGKVNLGAFYPLVLVPIGITGAANAVNMLAGFNGLEVGMGIMAMGSLAIIAAELHAFTSLVILLAGIGAALGIFYFNWYPARVFIGDVGTLSLGTIIASSVIIGNFEWAGVTVIVPYALDFVIKAVNGFPSHNWWGELREDGKLYCPENGPVGLCQLILKVSGGLHERTLTIVLMCIEALFGAFAVFLYLVVLR